MSLADAYKYALEIKKMCDEMDSEKQKMVFDHIQEMKVSGQSLAEFFEIHRDTSYGNHPSGTENKSTTIVWSGFTNYNRTHRSSKEDGDDWILLGNTIAYAYAFAHGGFILLSYGNTPSYDSVNGSTNTSANNITKNNTGGYSNPKDVVQYEKLKAEYAANEVTNAERIGSGLKSDIYHRAASYIPEEQLASGRLFDITREGESAKLLLQVNGQVNDKNGIFEYILNSEGKVTHQLFIPNGQITGYPIGGY